MTANVREMLSLLHKSFRESVYLSELVLCTQDVIATALLRYKKAPARTFFFVQKEKIGDVGSSGKKDSNLRFAYKLRETLETRKYNEYSSVGAVLLLCCILQFVYFGSKIGSCPKHSSYMVANGKIRNIRVNCFALCL